MQGMAQTQQGCMVVRAPHGPTCHAHDLNDFLLALQDRGCTCVSQNIGGEVLCRAHSVQALPVIARPVLANPAF